MTVVYFGFYLICALNIILGISKKKSNLLYVVALIVICALMSLNIGGPDIGVYIETYKSVGNAAGLSSAFKSTYMENGYTFLMYCANRVGLDFFAFRVIITVICLSLFVSTVKYYKANPNLIIGLYMAYVFLFDTIQFRNFIIQFIILFATRYLLGKSGYSFLKYILCVAVAGSLHTVSWVFLSLLLIKIFKRRVWYKRLFIFTCIMFGVCVILQPVFPQIINAISKLIKRGSGYFHSSVRYSYWIVMLFNMVGLLSTYLFGKSIVDKNTKIKIDHILRIKVIMNLFLPLCFINGSFYRIFRNLIVLDTIGLTLIYCNSKKTKAVFGSMAAQLFLVFGWLAIDLFRNREMNIIDFVLGHNVIYFGIDFANVALYLLIAALSLLAVLTCHAFFAGNKKQRKGAIICS